MTFRVRADCSDSVIKIKSHFVKKNIKKWPLECEMTFGRSMGNQERKRGSTSGFGDVPIPITYIQYIVQYNITI